MSVDAAPATEAAASSPVADSPLVEGAPPDQPTIGAASVVAEKQAKPKRSILPFVALAVLLALAVGVWALWSAVFAPTSNQSSVSGITQLPSSAAPGTTQADATAAPTLGVAATPQHPASTPTQSAAAFAFSTAAVASPELAKADLLYYNGRYAEAESAYRALAAQPADALLGLARTYQADGQTNEAVAAYKEFVNRYPTDPRRRIALFGLADLSKGLGLWQAAIDYYTQYLGIADTLAGYVYSDIGDCYTSLGDIAKADSYYDRAATSAASILVRVSAKERDGDNRLNTGDAAGAIAAYKGVLDLAKMADYRASVGFKLAGAFKVANKPDDYARQLRETAQTYPDTTGGMKALKALATLQPNSVDDVDRARILIGNEDWAGAATTLERYLNIGSDPTPKPTVTIAPATAPQATRQAQAWYLLGRAYLNTNRFDMGIAALKTVTTRYPTLTATQDALNKIGSVEEDVDLSASIAAYHALWSNYKTGSYAHDALTAEGRLQSFVKPTDAAIKNLTPIIAQLDAQFPTSPARAELYSRLATLKEAANDLAGAKAAWQTAAASPNHDYFAIRAVERLATGSAAYTAPKRSNPLANPAVYGVDTFAAELPGDTATMEAWLATWAQPKTGDATPTATADPKKALSDATARVQSDAGVLRLIELHQLGREANAQREAEEVVGRYADKPLELYGVSLILSQQRQYYWSVGAARKLYDLSPAPRDGFGSAPRLLKKLLYPLYFQDAVLDQSKRYDVDPLLVLAMIRQESNFSPNGAIVGRRAWPHPSYARHRARHRGQPQKERLQHQRPE